MYLTKIELDISIRAVRTALADCQRMHCLLNGLFDCGRGEAGLLYRLMDSGRNCAVYLYSNKATDKTKLLPGMKLAGERELGDLIDNLKTGRRLGFDILTMPSKKVSQSDSKNSRRRILRSAEERIAWLQKKSEQNGFNIIEVQELETSEMSGKHVEDNGGKMNWTGYHYSGLLEITDEEKFRKAVTGGIGPGKAYGLGMILLR